MCRFNTERLLFKLMVLGDLGVTRPAAVICRGERSRSLYNAGDLYDTEF